MERYRIARSLLVLAGWLALTVFLPPNQSGNPRDLIDIVAHGPAWNILSAALFALVMVAAFGWRDTGLGRWPAPGSLRAAWPVALYVVLAFAVAIRLGLPPARMAFWIGVNTLLVGLSEELMFRGILFGAFRARWRHRTAVLASTALFGLVHMLNVFITGDLLTSLIQAVLAFLLGLMFMALRLHTGSLWPPVLLHAMWDFATFLMSGNGAVPYPGQALLFVPMLMVPVCWLQAVRLLRAAEGNRKPAGG